MKIKKVKVIILCGPDLRHLNTCATLIRKGVNVVGICICNEKTKGIPLKYIRKSIQKKGFLKVFGQILGKIYYKIFNQYKDKLIHDRLFVKKNIDNVINNWRGEKHYTTSYSDQKTLEWLSALEADIFVVHTMSWVDKKVREMPRQDIIIGGHPGIVPLYRGAHSPFWAIYNGQPEKVGCSIFWLDFGVDTGDLINQEKIAIEYDDSYVTLSWKGMIREAEMQAETILNYQNSIDIPRISHKKIPDNSCYDIPTLKDYLRYRMLQKYVR